MPEALESDAPDTILINGEVLTVDDEFSVAGALAIKDERIVSVGDSETIGEMAGAGTNVIDLDGKTVIPGLIDNHIHFIRMPQRWNLQARIDGINTRQGVGADPAEGSRLGSPYIVAEPPYGLLNEQMPPVSAAQLEQNVLDVIAELNRVGLTSVYDVGRPPEGDITLLDRMSENGPLNLRVWHTLKYQAYGPDDVAGTIELIESNTANSTDDYLGLLGVGEHVYLPMFDLPNVTEPYPDEVVDEFRQIAQAAAEGGYRINEHSMMDITIQSILDAYEQINEEVPLERLRWSLEHVLTISEESIERAKDIGVTLAVHSVAMNMPPFLQPPIRKIQDSGIVWGLGTDASIVAAYQPFITLGWVTTGKSINGQTINEEPVTREEALIAHTRSNAFLLHREDDLGTLEVGKLADLVVLDRDYMNIPVDEIFDIQPVLTMVGGRVVYDASAEIVP
jgi:predicted amidohydrolase YtcJ